MRCSCSFVLISLSSLILFPTESTGSANFFFFFECISFNAYNITILRRPYPVTKFATRVVLVSCHITRLRPVFCEGRSTDLGCMWRVTSDLSVIPKRWWMCYLSTIIGGGARCDGRWEVWAELLGFSIAGYVNALNCPMIRENSTKF